MPAVRPAAPLRLTAADVGLVIVVALVGVYLAGFARPRTEGARVEISGPAGFTLTFPLDEARTVRVEGYQGETVVSIAAGEVRFITSPCPHKTCIRRGAVRRSGEWIACVPNGVVAVITGERDYDGITP
jgi:hypothetical protein